MPYSELYILTKINANDVKFISVDRQKLDLSIYIYLWYHKFYICRDTARFYEHKKWPSYKSIWLNYQIYFWHNSEIYFQNYSPCLKMRILTSFILIDYSPGADFCTGLSFWLGTTYLPVKVWLQKCNPGVFCNTPRYVVQLNCGSSFAVGRHLWTYPTLNEALVNWEENTSHVQPLLPIQHISL